QHVDDDNGARTVSPLVERLRWSEASLFAMDPPLVRPPHAPGTEQATRSSGAVPRPLLENAVEAALDAPRRGALGPILALGFDDLPAARETAAARLRIVDEMDPPPSRPAALGPYLGVVGPPLGEDDPRLDDTLYVTTLEKMCTCPWQTLLTRLLRIEPLPDPLETLPAIDPLLIGNVVHRAAEAMVTRSLGSGDGAAPPRGRLALPVGWPDESELDEILLAAAEGALRESGIGLPGFDRVVALAVRPFLDQLQLSDWPDGARVPVLGGEVREALELPEGPPPRRLAFRADRVDGPGGRRVYTDYKTGRRPITAAKREADQRKGFLEQVRAGERLQVPAYALAGRGSGRYLFLHPELDGIREIAAHSDDTELTEIFYTTVAAALDAWRQGAFPPRVVEADRNREPKACRWCEVAQACVRGDSGARRRLRDWAAGEEGAESGPLPAAHQLWRLPLGEGKP
ncbi:MAG: RecB family exonuclease, partial [Thermoanaerobaculia bacterium]